MSYFAEPFAQSFPLRRWTAELSPVALVLCYALAVHGTAAAIGRTGRIAWLLYLPYAVPATLFFACLGLCTIAVAAVHRDPGPSMRVALGAELRRRGVDARSALHSLPLLAALPVFLSLFSSYKALIPVVHPFAWDGTLAELDRVLHFGTDPWRLAAPLLAHPLAVKALDFLYHPGWSLLVFGTWTWLAIDRARPTARLQALLALPAAWIVLGSVGGTVLSSAGPCYFGEVGGDPDRFAPLLGRLAEIDAQWPLFSQAAQHALWTLYRTGSTGFGSGISAMPSVHVGSAFLMVLMARGGPLFAPATAFFLAISAGSVALGWHYAIDAYAAVAMVFPVWGLSGAIARRLTATPRS